MQVVLNTDSNGMMNIHEHLYMYMYSDPQCPV